MSFGNLPPLGQELVAVHVALRLPRPYRRLVFLLRRGLLLAKLTPNLLGAFRKLLSQTLRHPLEREREAIAPNLKAKVPESRRELGARSAPAACLCS